MTAIQPYESDRVRRHTPPEINARIDDDIRASISHYAGSSRETLTRRIDALDREWDIERILEANAASFSLAGLALSQVHSRRWLWLSTGVAGFLLQHALQGWCPPVSVFRRLGIRTRREIDREKYGLKALRGDFQPISETRIRQADKVSQAIEA
ncbi:DUF2892 domain-containing protein [Methylocaldum sp.]|uniref:YgaP family membrane protein n=1 Tax=Methylocaldum sp. TaxID=1969727 RepID=UPI002D678D13|nr:DUF2892 domain-containing protein [Methylocaldum sp.]HYE35543.1 DUF2892 domain-containing protein [Methylocaldum sp.]